MSILNRLGLCASSPVKVDLNKIAIKVFVSASMLFPARSMAAAGWESEATTMFSELESGLVSFVAPVIGIGIIVYGIWAMVTGRIDIMRLAQLVGGGALVMFGPTALRTLVGAGS